MSKAILKFYEHSYGALAICRHFQERWFAMLEKEGTREVCLTPHPIRGRLVFDTKLDNKEMDKWIEQHQKVDQKLIKSVLKIGESKGFVVGSCKVGSTAL